MGEKYLKECLPILCQFNILEGYEKSVGFDQWEYYFDIHFLSTEQRWYDMHIWFQPLCGLTHSKCHQIKILLKRN